MIYRNAALEDIPAVYALQQKYHISTIAEADKKDGFVTTLFNEAQLTDLIQKEAGLAIAVDGDVLAGYAMAASWEYWSQWPLFQHMIKDLGSTTYRGEILTTENSYQYGPICIDAKYRGTEVLPGLFDFSRQQLGKRYPILITFINQINGRSFKAHTQKLGLDVIKTFEFNNNHYYELGYVTANPLPLRESAEKSL